MKRRRGWIIALVILAGAIGGFLWFRNRMQANDAGPEILRTADIGYGDLAITVSASGNTSVNKQLDLRFDTTGTVTHIAVEENDRVRAGQELARLDTSDLERAVQQAQIALEQAQLNRDTLVEATAEDDLELAELAVNSAAQALEVARLGKQTAQIDANAMIVEAQRARENAFKDLQTRIDTDGEENARTNYERAEEQEYLAKINAELTVEQAETQWFSAYNSYQQAIENLAKLQDDPNTNRVRQADLQIEQAQLSLEQAQRNLDDAVLEAPFAGLIVAVNAQESLPAPVTLPAFSIVDDTDFYVDVTVDEIDIGKVVLGQTVNVTLDAYPDVVLAGTVDTIAPSATNVGGVIAYHVKIHLDKNADDNVVADVVLRDGMTASVVIQTGTVESILLVPNWAVKSDQSESIPQLYCYVQLADGTVERRDITLGRYNGDFTEVLTGLEEGDTVALVTEERNLFDFGPPGR